jgi:glycogen synthase
MRLLMTADTIGGVWTYAMDLAAALAEHDVEIALATMGRLPSDAQRAEARERPNVRLFESAYTLEWMTEPWDDIAQAGRWLLDIRDEFNPDIVHLNGYAHGALPWEVPIVVVGHSCVLSWWERVHGQPAPAEWGRYRAAVTEGARAADVLVAPTNVMRRTLERHYGPLRFSCVIPNGRSSRLFAPGPKHPFIFSAGRMWDAAKNLAVLDEAAAGLPWRVYVAGPIEHPDANGSFAESAVPRNAGLCGAIDQAGLGKWLSRADIYALPARYEPFGLSILEAALAGCALALGDIPSLRETWDGAAVFADPGDAGAVRQALLGLIRNPTRRRALAAEARTRALELTPQRMAAAYIDLYRRLLARRPSTAHVNGSAAETSPRTRSERTPERAASPRGLRAGMP